MDQNQINEVCRRYRELYAGAIYDVLEHFGYPNQVLSREFAPLRPERKLSGPALTVKGAATCERNEALRNKRLDMIKQMRRPCIEVRDCGTPFTIAMYGELSATTAAAHGAVGALVDGGTRDTGKLISMGFPVFARYRTPIEAFGRWAMVDHQVAVLVSGELTDTVQVNPGDFIFADYDGVLVIPQNLTLKVLEECERVIGIEDNARVEFARGDDPVEVFERHKRL